MNTKNSLSLLVLLATLTNSSFADTQRISLENTKTSSGGTSTVTVSISELSTDADAVYYYGNLNNNALSVTDTTEYANKWSNYVINWGQASSTSQTVLNIVSADDDIASLYIGTSGNAGLSKFNVYNLLNVYATKVVEDNEDDEGQTITYEGTAIQLNGKTQLNILEETTNVYGDIITDFGTTVTYGNAGDSYFSVASAATLNVYGNVTSEYNTDIYGKMTVSGNASFGASTGFGSNFTATTNIGGTLAISGNATFASITNFLTGSSTTISGATTISGTTTIDGTVSTNSLTLSGSNITSTGTGSLSVTDIATLSGTNILGVNTTISGATSISGTTTIDAIVSTDTLTLSAATITGTGSITATTDATLSGANTIGVDTTITSTTTAGTFGSSSLTINNGATVTFNNSVNLSSDSKNNAANIYITDGSTLVINGNLTNSAYNSTKTLTIDSTSTLDVSGALTIRGNINLYGTIDVDGLFSIYRVTADASPSTILSLYSGSKITGTDTLVVGNVTGVNNIQILLLGDYTQNSTAISDMKLQFDDNDSTTASNNNTINLSFAFTEDDLTYATGTISLGSFVLNDYNSTITIDMTGLSTELSTIVINDITLGSTATGISIVLSSFQSNLLQITSLADSTFDVKDSDGYASASITIDGQSITLLTDADYDETGKFIFDTEGVLSYYVVPEPSTYAMIFGALALGLAMYRRRK